MSGFFRFDPDLFKRARVFAVHTAFGFVRHAPEPGVRPASKRASRPETRRAATPRRSALASRQEQRQGWNGTEPPLKNPPVLVPVPRSTARKGPQMGARRGALQAPGGAIRGAAKAAQQAFES
jgi:hypothetical protein